MTSKKTSRKKSSVRPVLRLNKCLKTSHFYSENWGLVRKKPGKCPDLKCELFLVLESLITRTESEVHEFEPRLKSAKKTVSIKRRLKSWNIEYNFKWNQLYLSRVSNLSRGSNSLNSASDRHIEHSVRIC